MADLLLEHDIAWACIAVAMFLFGLLINLERANRRRRWWALYNEPTAASTEANSSPPAMPLPPSYEEIPTPVAPYRPTSTLTGQTVEEVLAAARRESKRP